jgi:hypothetical protein
MAVRIPLITDFDGRGIAKAKREFAQLEGVGQKTGFLLKKAFIPATAAIAGLAAAATSAVNAALEDQAAQAKLEGQLRRSTKATDAQVKIVNDLIDSQAKLTGIADDQLRPAMTALATATGSVTASTKLLTLAMDISVATGKPLEQVAAALGRAYNGQYTALQKLDPTLRELVKSGGSADEVFGRLNEKFGGAAQEAAQTTAGKFQVFKVRMDELKETIGASLLPIVEKLIPVLERLASWAEKNPTLFRNVAVAIGAISAAIVVLNVALATNPIVLITGAIIGLAAIMALNWPKIKKWFEDFRAEIDKTLGPLDELVTLFFEGFGQALNLGDKLFGSSPMPDPGRQPAGKRRMAQGGLVMTPTSAIIGEAGPEMVIPLDRLGQFGGGSNVTINVQGGDPNAVVDALRTYMRQNGAVPIRITNP